MIKSLIVILLTLPFTAIIVAQPGWEWTELSPMPEAVSNNAVSHGYSGDTLCVYSFCGIDASLEQPGIHLRAWKYNTISTEWSQLPDVPDIQGKIAASASYVDGKIYVIGGYYVNPNMSEVSSDKVHVFNTMTNAWESDGSFIPVAIDDQVQAVWKDSLIYVVTGWSDISNVNDVQIYDPANDLWTEGTPISNLNNWKAFGANGTFVNDTLFYYGGTSSGSFNAVDNLRRGVLNSDDPTEIEWTMMEDFPGGNGYRMAATQYDGRVFFIGGSSIAYNFDAIAYDGSGPVEPANRIATFYSAPGLWVDAGPTPYEIMDMRGIAQVSENSWIITGGIKAAQEVSASTYLLEYDPEVRIDAVHSAETWSVSYRDGQLHFPPLKEEIEFLLIDIKGRLIYFNSVSPGESTVTVPILNSGIYLVRSSMDFSTRKVFIP